MGRPRRHLDARATSTEGAQHPTNVAARMRVWGLGESRVARFGAEILEVIRGAEART